MKNKKKTGRDYHIEFMLKEIPLIMNPVRKRYPQIWVD
jgi:hypothetical protein